MFTLVKLALAGLSRRGMNTPSRKVLHQAILLNVTIETGSRIQYVLMPSGQIDRLDENTEKPPVAMTISVSKEEFRLGSAKKSGHREVISLLKAELYRLEKMAIVNRSGRSAFRAVYATPLSVAQGVNGVGVPVAAVLDRLLIAHQNTKPPFVTGVMFGDDSLLVLAAYLPNGATAYQIIIAPEPEALDRMIEGFATAALPSDADVEPFIFTGDEFYAAAMLSAGDSYPIDGHGISGFLASSQGRYAAFGLSAAMAAGTWGFAYYSNHAVLAAQQQESAANAAEQQSYAQISTKIVANPDVFVKILSANFSDGFAMSESLWQQGGKISADIKQAAATYTLTTPLYEPNGKERIPGAGSRATDAMSKLPPKGCSINSIEVPGNVNEIKIKYSCMGRNSPIASRFR